MGQGGRMAGLPDERAALGPPPFGSDLGSAPAVSFTMRYIRSRCRRAVSAYRTTFCRAW